MTEEKIIPNSKAMELNAVLAVTSDSKKNKKESEVSVCPDCGGDTLSVVGMTFCSELTCKWERAN